MEIRIDYKSFKVRMTISAATAVAIISLSVKLLS